MVTATIKPRSEISKEHTWNAESVFPDRAAWHSAVDEVLALLPTAQKYQGKLADGAAVLAEYREISEQINSLVYKLFFYAVMSTEVDSNDKEATAMRGKISGVFGQVRGSLAFFQPELLTIGRETLEKWITEEPRLGDMTQYVDDLFRQQQHIRSAEVEQVLGLMADPFSAVQDAYSALSNSDLKFAPAVGADGTEHTVAPSTIDTLLDNPDRDVRRTAWHGYTDAFLAHKNTFTATYLGSVKQDVFNARVRGYGSSVEASLFDNNVPAAVLHNLLDTYKQYIPTWHKYWAVRRKALGYDDLHPYDIWAPIAKTPPHVPYAQSVEWISEGMKPLGEDYVHALRRGCLEDRWVDIYPNEGKRAGAFSFGTHDTYPFIMMSYDDSMGALSTLAHELGHSMHSYLSRKTQPRVYSSYSLFVAEVASNFNQAMTRAHLREAYADDVNFQIALIEEAMSNFHRYFFIMPTLARFEMEVHDRVEKGQGMNADDLNTLMTELFSEGYGGEMQIDADRVGITWATFGHLYSAFYVYQYATGISAAHALAEDILKGDEGAAQRYVEFLSAGSSMYPLDALKHAGVDMTQPDAVETTFGVLAGMVDRLEELTS